MTEIPRSSRLYLNIPAELSIRDAMRSVEELPAHPLLTDAVVLLGQAKEKVSEWFDKGRKGTL